MGNMFKKAERKNLKLRMALNGPSGSGKTYTGLRFAFALADGGKVGVIDTEYKSASKECDKIVDDRRWQFDVCELTHFSPSNYTQAIDAAVRGGISVLLIDSLSHAWEGKGGALDLKDKKAAETGNSFTAWKEVTPMHRAMVEAILAAPIHVIATMRTKTEYVMEQDSRGKSIPRKVGMAPIQRAGMEYEFDIVADLDIAHTLSISKTRCSAVDGKRVTLPDGGFMDPIIEWLGEGKAVVGISPSPEFKPAGSTTTHLVIDPADTDGGSHDKSSARSSEPCSPDQVGKIKKLAAELKMPTPALVRVIKKRGAAKLAQLSIGQADDIIGGLTAKLLDEGGDIPF